MMMKINDVAIIIPCYNEEITIANVIDDYKKYFSNIYVVDNNCTDNTVDIAKRAGVNIIKQPIQGKGAAIRKAFKLINTDYIILTDGDCTYKAKDSYKLYKCIKSNNYDMVIGNRLNSKYFKHNQKLHKLANNIFRICASIKFKHNIKDLLSGSRILAKNFYKSVKITKNGFQVETELIKKCKNYTFIDIGYYARPKNSKSSIHAVRDSIKILLMIFI